VKFNPVTLVLLLLALILGGVVYFTQGQGAIQGKGTAQATLSPGAAQPILTFPAQQVQQVSLKTQLHTLVFEKDHQGIWLMKEPEQVTADGASVNYLLGLMLGKASDRPITVTQNQKDEFGLNQPMADIQIRLANQTTHRLVIGGYNFNRSSLYAEVDPPAAPTNDLTLLLVSQEFDTAVNRSLAEWKAALPSPSPSPSPSP